MTNEKREAIEYIKKRIKVCNENADVCDDNDFDEEATYLREESYMLETVLNMLKEKDSEIERLEQTLTRNIARNVTSSMKETAKAKEDLEMLNKGWQIELEKKDKQIDLMTVTIIQKDIGKCYCEFDEKCCKCEDGSRDIKCKDCIKQYFERKSKK